MFAAGRAAPALLLVFWGVSREEDPAGQGQGTSELLVKHKSRSVLFNLLCREVEEEEISTNTLYLLLLDKYFHKYESDLLPVCL